MRTKTHKILAFVLIFTILQITACSAGSSSDVSTPNADRSDSTPSSIDSSAKNVFPSKDITWIIPYPPGGGVENLARGIAPYLSKELGVNVVVKNVPGAGSKVGYVELLRSEPDGHTILSNVEAFFVDGRYWGDLDDVEPPDKLEWIAMQYQSPWVLATGKDSPYLTWEDLRNAEKPLNVADSGRSVGGLTLPLGLLSYLDIPHSVSTGWEGQGQIIPALLRGEVDLTARSVGALQGLILSGDVRILVQGGSERHKLLPDVPTIIEVAEATGIPEMANLSKRGPLPHVTAAPPGTPADRVKILEDAFQAVLTNPDFVAWAEENNQDIVQGARGDAVRSFIKEGYEALESLNLKELVSN